MVSLISQNYNTKHYIFSIDSSSDIDLLPKYNIAGKGVLAAVLTCSYGSKAVCTNGDTYILKGSTNEWVKYTSSSSSSGGSEIPEGYTIATTADIDNLF